MDSRQRLAAITAIDGSNTTIAVLGSQQSTDIGPDDRLFNSEPSTPAALTNLNPLPTISNTSNQQLEEAAAPTAHLDADGGANPSTSASTPRQVGDLIPDETDNSNSGRDQNGSVNPLQTDSERELRETRNPISQYGSAIRVFGTHEEVERQGSDYVSPIAQPSTNTSGSTPDTIAQLPNPSASTQQAGPRHHIVPELISRRSSHGHLPGDDIGDRQQPIFPTMAQSNGPGREMERLLLEGSRSASLNNDPLPSEIRDGSMLARVNPFSSGPGAGTLDGSRVQRSNNIRGPIRTRPAARRTNRDSLEAILRLTDLFAGDNPRRRRPRAAQPSVGPNVQEPRPPGLTREEMTVERDCKICMDQLATIALIPCGMVASLHPAYK